MAALSEFNSAAQLREIIRGYAAEVVDEERPPTRYAIVTAVHPTLRVATVRYPDEVATFTIPYGSAQPVVTHTVRVAGKQGARYIEDVLHTGTSEADSVPSGQKIYHRIAGNNILTIQNPNDPATTSTFGGYVMEMHPGYSGAYLTLHPAHYGTSGYVLLNDTNNTFLSANATGTVYIRAGANDGAHQIAVHSASVDIAGPATVSGNFSSNGGVAYTNSTGIGTSGLMLAGSSVQAGTYVRAEGSYLSSDTDTHTRNYGKTGHRIRIGAWAPDPNWTCYIGNCGYILYDNVTSGANAYVRAYGVMNIGGTSITMENQVNAAGQLRSQGPAGDTYNLSNLFADSPGVAVASNGYHPSGVACQFRMGKDVQRLYLAGINGGTINVDFITSTVNGVSSSKYKQDITYLNMDEPVLDPVARAAVVASDAPLPEPVVVNPIEVLKRVKPIWFRYEKQTHLQKLPATERRTDAYNRLNAYRASQNMEPFDSPELHHECGRDCGGSPEFPCPVVLDWESGSIGFIAEEIGEVLPQVAKRDAYTGEFTYIDAIAMAGYGVSVSKFQQEMIEALTARVEALEAQVASLISSGTQQ